MKGQVFSLEKERRWLLNQASADFFFLQNRRYPRGPALEWVGNRYGLIHMERQLLHRGVFGRQEALRRRARQCKGRDWRESWLAVDGHNVQITVESAMLGRPLLQANDGVLRDLAGQSARFRMTEMSEVAMDVIFRLLRAFRPRRVLFLFDAPMSHSGLLAQAYRQRLSASGVPGDARAVPVPERELPYDECVVASSDQAVLEKASRALDLARWALDAAGAIHLTADFAPLALLRTRPEVDLFPF